MDKMVLVIDESGAKGYASTKEKYEGEIGLIAGFLYTEEEMNQIELSFDRVLKKYYPMVIGKFHITELNSESQIELREEVFHALKQMKLQWFYTAIYAEGFHQSEFSEGRSGNKNNKKSLHSVLFSQIFIMGLFMSASIGKNDLFLYIRTDNIDQTILKKFEKEAKFTSDLILERERNIFKKVWNKKTGEVKKYEALTYVKSDDLPKFIDIKYDIRCEESSLTIVADILANSVHYYLRENQKEKVGTFINNREAIKNHPLVDLAYIPKNTDHMPNIIDFIYRRN